jgi:hypothetical protein
MPTNLEGRLIHLEQLLTAQADALLRLQQQVAALQQAVRVTQSSPYGAGGGGNGTYWATNPSAVSAATGSTIAGLTPSTFTSNIYYDAGGTMTLQQSSATVYWWYLDGLPANSLVPVTQSGANWDALANGCTAL